MPEFDFGTIAGLLGGGLGAKLAERGYEKLEDIGQRGYEGLVGLDPNTGEILRDAEGRPTGLAQQLEERLQFQPYTVTSATGGQFGMAEDPTTGQMEYELSLSQAEKDLQDAQLARAEGFFGQAAAPLDAREQQVYERMRAAMTPEEERQRLAMEQRLASQGRLGVRTGMFGGTPEALAMEKALAEARNQTILNAMQFAGEEQQRQAQLGTGMLAAGYVPQAQLLGAIEPGMTAAERQRQAISEQTGAYGETYTSGLQALLSAGLGQADIASGLGSSLAETALSSLFS